MTNRRARLIALAFCSALEPAAAVEWHAVPPLPPLPAQSPTWQSLNEPNPASSANATLNWEPAPHPKGAQQIASLTWKTIDSNEVIDPAVALAAEKARSEAFSINRSGTSLFRPYFYTPYLGGAEPTAYVDQWGEGYIAGYGGLPNVVRDYAFESTINVGLGLGDPDRFVAITAGWDIGSTKDLNANGSFSLSMGRVLVETDRLQITAGGGLSSLAPYGNETGADVTNGYGVVTLATPLRSNPDFAQLLQLSFGIGGNDFAPSSDGFVPEQQTGYFVALGLQATPGIGVSLGRSGRGANAVISILPNNDLPVYLELAAVDLFNETPGGTKGVFGVRFGGRNLYRPRQP